MEDANARGIPPPPAVPKGYERDPNKPRRRSTQKHQDPNLGRPAKRLVRGQPMTRLMTRFGPHDDERIEGRNTLHDKTYVFEREDDSHEDKPKPSPRVVDLEPGAEKSSVFRRDLNKDAEIDISDPNPDDPPVGTVLAKIHARLRDKAKLLTII